jgi:hypothetical protein
MSCRLKEMADASMRAVESLTPPQAATKIMKGMAEWRNGRMAEWRTEWRNGRKNGRMVKWQKWIHTYYLWYTPTPTTPTTLKSFTVYKPIGPTAWKSVQGCLLYHL